MISKKTTTRSSRNGFKMNVYMSVLTIWISGASPSSYLSLLLSVLHHRSLSRPRWTMTSDCAWRSWPLIPSDTLGLPPWTDEPWEETQKVCQVYELNITQHVIQWNVLRLPLWFSHNYPNYWHVWPVCLSSLAVCDTELQTDAFLLSVNLVQTPSDDTYGNEGMIPESGMITCHRDLGMINYPVLPSGTQTLRQRATVIQTLHTERFCV